MILLLLQQRKVSSVTPAQDDLSLLTQKSKLTGSAIRDEDGNDLDKNFLILVFDIQLLESPIPARAPAAAVSKKSVK